MYKMYLKNASLLRSKKERLGKETYIYSMMDTGLAFRFDCLLLVQKHPFSLVYLIFTSICCQTLHQIKETIIHILPCLWKPKQQNLNFSIKENNFSSQFYGKTKVHDQNRKRKTLKIMLWALCNFAAQNRTHTVHATKWKLQVCKHEVKL